MKRSAIVFASLFILTAMSACAHAPKPPEGSLCGINAQSSYILCFDLSKDFDENGKLRPNEKDKDGNEIKRGTRKPISLLDLHKGWFLDAPSKESLQAYALKWKQRYQDLQKNCK